ncbi:MAG: DUF2283 domain-containing protein [Candidatus Doudnabacteria bacterium]|nr:DUF2283 domain-containing protein [Candidatus Doudnabacteria bacterium]
MQVEYDPQADAVYISLQKKKVYKSREVSPGVVLDLGKDRVLIGIEILDASKHFANKQLVNFSVKTFA